MEEEDWGFTNDIYQSFFQMTFEWPCLSFDILRDNLGAARKTYPHTAYFVSATQAENEDENQLLVTKISDLQNTKNDGEVADGELLPDPKIRVCGNFHPSTANRVRSMPQTPNIIATWTETSGVLIWDVAAAIASSNTDSGDGAVQLIHECSFDDEGYGLAWSGMTPGLLCIGDSSGKVSLWQQTGGSFSMTSHFNGHDDSIEDIVFSPNDIGIFSTCGCDQHICIWDSRDFRTPIHKFKAHTCDINVISWNSIQRNLIASGADDGRFSVWDIRMISSEVEPVASFDYHQDSITSIEWNPNDESELAVACAEGRITIWDLSVEAVDPEEREEGIPDQMMFEHPIEDPKELHYHPQIPSLIAVTGMTFDVFIPDIVEDGEEEENKKE